MKCLSLRHARSLTCSGWVQKKRINCKGTQTKILQVYTGSAPLAMVVLLFAVLNRADESQPARSKQLSMVAAVDSRFGLYRVAVVLSFLRSISPALSYLTLKGSQQFFWPSGGSSQIKISHKRQTSNFFILHHLFRLWGNYFFFGFQATAVTIEMVTQNSLF